jgi:hypothetical protein
MATITWPTELPATLLLEGLSKQPHSSVIRTTMDAGPKKARRRYTGKTYKYSGKQIFDAAQLLVFEVFYCLDLADGVLRFNFTDPVTLETGEFRFTADFVATAIEGHFEVSMQLEKMS